MKWYDNFIGSSESNQTFLFYEYDSQELFNANLNKMPKDWYYRNNTITYELNELGHRSPNVNNLDFNNYILFCGDSHTFGIGLELEKTYPYLTAKQLQTSYYNIGLGGTGVDAMYYNFNTWVHTYKKPKLAVFYWSDFDRFLYYHNDELIPYLVSKNIEDCNRFVYYGDIIGYFNTRAQFFYKNIELISSFHNIPTIHISFMQPIKEVPYTTVEREPNDDARDLRHAGIQTHQSITDCVVSEYTTKYSNATVHPITRGQN